ncbi:MAG TPA: GTP-binding protein, partial [Candidatus Limnocylindrales bacterium]|nr:GTP-binding protein [Candidatus Limnocylindrales bacterium]
MDRTRIIIMGAAGRDFHDFNVVYRNDPAFDVVAFTATQIPGIADRWYPEELAGPLYPGGVPIVPEAELERLIAEEDVDTVVFAYSDVSHEAVMHAASRVLAAGADFQLLGPHQTMLAARKPVIAVCATRSGAGKSQTTRHIAGLRAIHDLAAVVIRHPMPYGDLATQAVQRYATYADLDRFHTTIEEREEYEPHLDTGRVVYAGVDYETILRQAEAEADVILWDGGNNDFPFCRPDLLIVVADPLRPGDETRYHPGETNLRMADVVIINKVDSATPGDVSRMRAAIEQVNAKAVVLTARSELTLVGPQIAGRRVAVVEDGPTLTHGGMTYGAGVVAARRFGAAELVDPTPFAVGSIRDV